MISDRLCARICQGLCKSVSVSCSCHVILKVVPKEKLCNGNLTRTQKFAVPLEVRLDSVTSIKTELSVCIAKEGSEILISFNIIVNGNVFSERRVNCAKLPTNVQSFKHASVLNEKHALPISSFP